MNVNEIIGNNLKKYRSAYNMTLNELSERLHKSISTISKYEKGSIAMDIPTFLEISQIFQISPSTPPHKKKRKDCICIPTAEWKRKSFRV